MAFFKTFYGRNRAKNDTDNIRSKDDNRHNLILKTPNYEIRLNGEFVEVSDGILSQIYGARNLKAIYIHKDMQISIGNCYAISKFVKIYFIDARGNILGEYKRYKIL